MDFSSYSNSPCFTNVTRSILLVLSIIRIYFNKFVILRSFMPLVSIITNIYLSVSALMGGMRESVNN